VKAAFTMAEIARREEGHAAHVLRGMATESRPFAGGTMARGEPGAWFNLAQGVGLAGPVREDEIAGFITFFEERGIEPRIEVCPFAHESLIAGLASERFSLARFEMVLFRALSAAEDFAPPFPTPRGLLIEQVDPRDARAVDEYARVSLSGFLPPGMDPTPELLAAAQRSAMRDGSFGVRAVLDGRCVGAGAISLQEDLAVFGGVTVVPDMRRKGIQLALMAWRLRFAAAHGAVVATIGSLPAAPTESNASRMGFAVAYAKVVLVRPGPGLAPIAMG